jgi:hypothetical protein
VLHGGRRDGAHRLEAPPFHALGGDLGPRAREGFLCRLIARVRRAEGDPFLEIRDHRWFELRALGGHLEVVLLVLDRAEQQALGGFAGDDHRAALAALLPAGARVEAEAALLLLRAVALVTMLGEDGADALFKKLRLLRRERGKRGSAGDEQREAEHVGE